MRIEVIEHGQLFDIMLRVVVFALVLTAHNRPSHPLESFSPFMHRPMCLLGSLPLRVFQVLLLYLSLFQLKPNYWALCPLFQRASSLWEKGLFVTLVNKEQASFTRDTPKRGRAPDSTEQLL